MPSTPSQEENARIFYGKYEGDNPMNLIFLVSSQGNIQVKKVTGNIEELRYITLSGTFNVDLEVEVDNKNGVVSDLDLGYDPIHQVHYIAVAIKYEVVWPRDYTNSSNQEYMNINK